LKIRGWGFWCLVGIAQPLESFTPGDGGNGGAIGGLLKNSEGTKVVGLLTSEKPTP
jgi:hypothetical protein